MGNTLDMQTNDLSGQVAIITGGGRGLGRAFAQAIAKAGGSVAVIARTEEQLQETVRLIEETGGTAIAFAIDVTDASAMASVVAAVEQRLGQIDILINNAAVLTPLGNDWEIDPMEWWRTLEINVLGPFLATQAVLPGMMARRAGRIVNVSSGAGHTVHPYGTAYCTSKAALTHMTNLLAAGVKEFGINVFALDPLGPTAMAELLATSAKVPTEMNTAFRKFVDEATGLTESVSMLMFMLSGRADGLNGRQFSWGDSPDELLRRKDDIVRDDLYTLRLRV